MLQIIQGDCLTALRTLPDESVNCCVTSPPYWGLRDYGLPPTVWGGDSNCEHDWTAHVNIRKGSTNGRLEMGSTLASAGSEKTIGAGSTNDKTGTSQRRIDSSGTCSKCGAWLGCHGLEPTPDLFVAHEVLIFREVRRVLRSDGTCWLNLGDCYATGAGKVGDCPGGGAQGDRWRGSNHTSNKGNRGSAGVVGPLQQPNRMPLPGLKPKDLCGIPWRVAFALQADGWVLRQEIIWGKPNPMPESVTDRCTKAHEQIFLFAKAKWSGPPKRRFSHISSEDARWLALFLDAEGNICAKRAKAASGTDHFGLQICFANTCQALLAKAHSIIGAGTVLERAGKNHPMFYYQLSNKQAADVLYELYPHLIIKQRQAALGLHLQSLIAESEGERRSKEGKLRGRMRDDDYTDELVKIWATMKSLNHFGNPDLSWVPTPEYGRWSDCERYAYDAEAIKEQSIDPESLRPEGRNPRNGDAFTHSDPDGKARTRVGFAKLAGVCYPTRNRRTVWTVPIAPYSDAHFATFPPDLIKPCILAGCPVGGTVLDPFGGSGTTGQVALELGRKAILIELNPKYVELIRARTNVTPGLPLA